VSISCHKICLLLLRNPRVGVRSLQKVSVNSVPQICDFAEGPSLRYVISTARKYRFYACFILLRDLHFGVRSLQFVSVDFVPQNSFDFAEVPALSCAISTARECQFHAMKSV
jgi:hypothetical protein